MGLYRYIAENAEQGSDAYWDAMCAIDILTTGTNTTGHDYGTMSNSTRYEGPVPDGVNGGDLANIHSEVDLASRTDAVSLDNFAQALDFIDEFNQKRANENQSEDCSLSTTVGMNCRLMAISAVQLDYSKDYSSGRGHSQAYHVGENLSWGYTDPFVGWYDEEKADWKEGVTSGVGHYLNIVDQLPTGSQNPTVATGFAVNTGVPTYRVAHGQVFHTTSGYSQFNPSITYSTAQFRTQWFEPYYNAQVAAGMLGATDEVKQQHRADLATAQAAEAEAQAALDQANADLAAAQEAAESSGSNMEEVQARLDDLNGQTAGLEEALATAQQAAEAAHADAETAQANYEAALAHADELANNPDYAQLRQARDDAQATLDAANAAVAASEGAVAEAQARLDEYTDLSKNESISIDDIPSQAYTGEAICPRISVKLTLSDGSVEPLAQGQDFTVSYRNNVHVGTATATIDGCGDFQGSVEREFTVKAASIAGAKLVLSKTSYTYNGKVQKPAAKTVGGKTLKAGADYTLTYSNANSKNAGSYTVKAVGKGDYAGTSAAATYTIAKAAQAISAKSFKVSYTAKKKGKTKILSANKTVNLKTKAKASAKTALKYAKANKAGGSKITVSSTTGKMTLKKGLKAGTYKVSIKLTAAANANYKAATAKKITVTVNVK